VRRRTYVVVSALIAVAAVACGANGSAPQAALPSAPGTEASSETPAPAEKTAALRLRLVTVARDFESPVYVASTPSQPKRLYVVEQVGRIRVIQNGRVLPGAFLDIGSLVSCCGERGLLSMAFHPDYARNRLFYVDYTDRGGDTRVVEYRARSGGSPARVRELLFVSQPYPNHNGGQLQFGPDGMLYVGMGDGGSGGDPENRAQNLSSRLGKLLRGDVDASNPDWEIVGYGLRNPWRFSFDRATDGLYIADVGQGDWEEIDHTSRAGAPLENYGWDVYEGNHRFEDKDPSGNGQLVFPIYEYNHGQGCSVTGGYVYRGSSIPAARGRYFFGDYCSGTIWSLVVKDGKATSVKRHAFKVDALTSFGESASGELYLVSQEGTIFRLAKR
jgi:glucose/arabinose dehydrogenase